MKFKTFAVSFNIWLKPYKPTFPVFRPYFWLGSHWELKSDCPDPYWTIHCLPAGLTPPRGSEEAPWVKARWLDINFKGAHHSADQVSAFMPQGAAIWANEKVHQKSCIFNALLENNYACGESHQNLSDVYTITNTFQLQTGKFVILPLPSSQIHLQTCQAQCVGIFLTDYFLDSGTGFIVCSNH